MDALPDVSVGGEAARVVFASATRVIVEVPAGLETGLAVVRVGQPGTEAEFPGLSIGGAWATGLHQVDSPLFEPDGSLLVTYSGARGQEAPVSIFRVTRGGTREPFVSGIVNATSMARGPDGLAYVSSRFEGAVYRITADGKHEQVVTDLGVACGLAFDEEGSLYVGDRSGTVFRVRDGRAAPFATLPPSVAAFHLAMSPKGELFVSAPTLGSYDHVYRIDRAGEVRAISSVLGRPQGLAFSPEGVLHVTDSLAGSGGLYRFEDVESAPELVVSGTPLVGVAFGPAGELVVSSNETAYRFN